MLAAFARRLARDLGCPPEEEEVLLFGLQVLVNQALGVAAAVIAGVAVGALGPVLCALAVAGSTRLFAGGAHAATSRDCLILSTAALALAGWAAARLAPLLDGGTAALLGAAGGAAALGAVAAWAPREAPGKPLFSPAHRRAMRRASFLAVAGWLAVLIWFAAQGWWSPAGPGPWRALYLGGLLGLAGQAFSLSPAAPRLVARAESILNTGRRWGP